MRSLVVSTAFAALLAACSPPTQGDAEPPSSGPAAAVQACNELAPDLTRLVRIEEQMAVSAAASDLRGGSITPGRYDLSRAARIGAATGWQGERAVALDVSEDAQGVVTFEWAGAAAGGEVDRWSATLSGAAPQARLSYTCGRMGAVDAAFAVTAETLQLRLPDGANGALQLDFERRR
jgi:hypothetical protein